MSVPLSSLSHLLHGCCGISPLGAPMRFPQEQLACINSERFRNIASCAAGIYMAFTTDAREISFDYSISDAVYVINSGIDIYENGVFAAHHPVENGAQDVRISYICKADAPCEIKIYFPAGVVFMPKNFSIGNAQPIPRREKCAVFYGSSSTQSAYTPHPSMTWPEYVARHLEAECVNRGIGSFYYDASTLPDAADCAADYVFSMYGGNDVLYFPSLADALAEAEKFLAKLRMLYPEAEIFVASPDYMRRKPMEASMCRNIALYSAALPDICARHNMHFVPATDMIADLPTLFCEDNVHFNLAGIAHFAANYITKISHILK